MARSTSCSGRWTMGCTGFTPCKSSASRSKISLHTIRSYLYQERRRRQQAYLACRLHAEWRQWRHRRVYLDGTEVERE